MLIAGIVFGLMAATLQALSYLQSRHFVGRSQARGLQLLLVAHVLQGGVWLVLLPVLWPADAPPWRAYLGPIVIESLGYLVGQACLFTALRHAEASRVAPLLSLKIAILALLSPVVLGSQVTLLQWGAVVLAVAAAWLLKWMGGRFTPRLLALLLLGCTGYAMSDLYIRVAIERMAPVPPLHAALWACALSYVFCGLAVLPLAWWVRGVRPADVRRAVPYAGTWLLSMACLYTCFAFAGVILGNIVQSSRGLLVILVGPWLARHRDWGHLEPVHPPHAIARRAACALLMVAAVALYVLGAP